MRTTMKLVLATAIASITLQANAATPEGQLTLWVEADKAYEGMAKVGDWFENLPPLPYLFLHAAQ